MVESPENTPASRDIEVDPTAQGAESGHRAAVLVISSLRRGGAEGVCVRLANALASRGDKITIMTLAPQNSDGYVLHPNIVRIALELESESTGAFQGILSNARRIVALRSTFKRIANGPIVSFLSTMNVLTVAATTGSGRRVVVCERNRPAAQSLGNIWDLLRRWSYRRASLVTVNSDEAANDVRSWGVSRTVRLPNPPVERPKRLAQPEASQCLLNVGRLALQKGQDTLIEAFAQLADEHAGWTMTIVGKGPENDALRRLATRLGLADRIRWRSDLDETELADQYANAAIFALPSRFEGTPNTLLEAIATGLPVIVSDRVGGGMEMATDGTNGFVVRSDDPTSLANCLGRLMDNAAMRAAFGRASLEISALSPPDAVLARWTKAIYGP
jgi:GalNAc-alpha-(1->4)-GalNAc-alpha-(1->3)-diNAcBac-PP-undecaprenol alpha-1,4-N-acetyl-D-galactosaminyltransferase